MHLLVTALVVRKIEEKDTQSLDVLAQGVTTAIASKQFGQEGFLSKLVAEAAHMVMPQNPYNFHVENVRSVVCLFAFVIQVCCCLYSSKTAASWS